MNLYLNITLLQAGHICNEVVGIAHILTVHWQDDSAGEVPSGLQKGLTSQACQVMERWLTQTPAADRNKHTL